MDRVWGKVKNATKIMSSSEEDGDSEQSTAVHKAMLRYYEEHGQMPPEWLAPRRAHQHQAHLQSQTQSPSRSQNSQQQSYQQAPQPTQKYEQPQAGRSASATNTEPVQRRPPISIAQSMGHLNISTRPTGSTPGRQPSANSRMMEKMRSGQSARIARRT
ncbi:unnamed protein product [Kuraishia capsulata CBS 1993]|uniref:Mso1 N-terminal domain-containing protein n=1 Tax=Kuraishia capsulata CBS 1993 TaxID=1382522 RepID=W6MUA7_9ASCO|nr:uncharacterized protein KUCA_T00005049001 [Kuraishia capsulata CBS 1993]CDK29062.1 unnamed protein product [Kuraishia capsulata CBS 1993]